MSNPGGFNYVFDATRFEPNQGPSIHPVGKFPADIVDAKVVPTKDNNGGRYVVVFRTTHGNIDKGYNLWNANSQATEIAHKELSALSHAIGVFKIDMNNGGKAVVGHRCVIEVALQRGEAGAVNGYTEVKKVFDQNGNEPGAAGNQPPQPAYQPGPNFAPQQPQTAPGQAPWGQPGQGQQPPQTAPWGQGQQPTDPNAGGFQPPQQPGGFGSPPPGWGQPPR